MWTPEDRVFLHVKWLQTVRRWKRLNLDSLVQASGFLFLLALFWYLSFDIVSKLCRAVYSIEVIGPIILKRMAAFGFFAAFIVVTVGHVLTAFSSLFRGRELHRLFYSPYDLTRLYRIQSLETLFLGGWVSGIFCLPILIAYGWQLHSPWWYYPLVISGLGGFLVTAGMVGILCMLVLARWVIGRPLRFVVLAFLLLAAFGFMFLQTADRSRILLSGSVDTAKLGETLANLRLSSQSYLPSQWMSELMNSGRTDDVIRSVVYLSALWSTALFLWALSRELGARWYADAWLWAQEHTRLRSSRSDTRRYRRRALILPRLLPRRIGAIVYKEVHVFARDFSQWGQLVLILFLVLFYVAHTQNMILDSENMQVRNQLVFFNVILLGFIQATLSLRYTFPSISLEGRAYWTVVSSGTGVERFFFTKYYMHALVLLVIGEGMVFLLNRILNVDMTLNLLSYFVLFLFSFGFTSWSMGFGALFRKFEATNAADVTSDTGALVAMIVTLLYYGISIAFLAYFALLHTPGAGLVELMALRSEMIGYIAVFLLIQSAAILFPVYYGLRSLENVEF